MMRFNPTSVLVYEELSGFEIRRARKSSSGFEPEKFGTEVWKSSFLHRRDSGPPLVSASKPHSYQDRLSTLSGQYRGEYFVGDRRWPAWEGVTTCCARARAAFSEGIETSKNVSCVLYNVFKTRPDLSTAWMLHCVGYYRMSYERIASSFECRAFSDPPLRRLWAHSVYACVVPRTRFKVTV